MDNILFLVLNNVRRVVTASSELVGEYDENNTTIERYGIDISQQEPNKEYTSSYKQKLLDIESNLRPIGLFLSKKSKNLYVFFHLGKAIKYCIVDDVSQTEYSGNLVKLFDILVLEEKLQSVVWLYRRFITVDIFYNRFGSTSCRSLALRFRDLLFLE